MAPRTKVPDKTTLRRWRDEGLTQQEMVERTLQETGEIVSRSGIANAMAKAGLSADGPRYEDEVPWQINPIHATSTPLRMLRLLGRRNSGKELNSREREALDTWLHQLNTKGWIVGYDKNDMRGFHYISAEYKDHDADIPVRRRMLRMAAAPQHAEA